MLKLAKTIHQKHLKEIFISGVTTYKLHCYMDMCGVDTFKFIAVTTTHPYTVEVYTLSDEIIEFGRNAYKQAFSKWKLYLESGIMPGYHWYKYDKDGSYIL
jgi:hypothetical protein